LRLTTRIETIMKVMKYLVDLRGSNGFVTSAITPLDFVSRLDTVS
jgi:hypothetical protein